MPHLYELAKKVSVALTFLHFATWSGLKLGEDFSSGERLVGLKHRNKVKKIIAPAMVVFKFLSDFYFHSYQLILIL
jgi:hypothetical protein